MRATLRLALPVLSLCLAAGAALADHRDRDRRPPGGQPVQRGYVTVDGLQIHYREARPDGDRQRLPVVALHQSPNSGQVYVEFMSLLARDRRVVAPDTPGYGGSDRPPAAPAVRDYARYMEGLAERLGLEQVDLVGYHTGASIAVEWARLAPERVRRLMLVGLPAFDQEERAALAANPWPSPEPLDAARVAAEWRGSKAWQGPGQSDESIERTYLAKLGAGRTGWWGPAAVSDHAFLERLAGVEQPVTVVRPRDDLWEISDRVRQRLPALPVIDLPERGFGVFETDPERMAGLAREAFDGSSSP